MPSWCAKSTADSELGRPLGLRHLRGGSLQILRFGGKRLNVGVDLYNTFNANTPQAYESVYDPATNGARWLQPTSVLLPRFARVNVQFDF